MGQDQLMLDLDFKSTLNLWHGLKTHLYAALGSESCPM